MVEPAVTPNQQQAGIRSDNFDSSLTSVPAPSKNGLCFYPHLQENIEEPLNVGGDLQDVHHVIPGRDEVEAPSGSGDAGAVTKHLLQDDQMDIEAGHTLGVQLSNNAFTAQIYWRILTRLKGDLSKAVVPHRQEYARILCRLAGGLIQQDRESAHYLDHLNDVEFLEELLQDMTTIFLKRTENEEDVYISNDRDLYAERLRSLAARLRDV